jgi:hypothetical protein
MNYRMLWNCDASEEMTRTHTHTHKFFNIVHCGVLARRLLEYPGCLPFVSHKLISILERMGKSRNTTLRSKKYNENITKRGVVPVQTAVSLLTN